MDVSVDETSWAIYNSDTANDKSQWLAEESSMSALARRESQYLVSQSFPHAVAEMPLSAVYAGVRGKTSEGREGIATALGRSTQVPSKRH